VHNLFQFNTLSGHWLLVFLHVVAEQLVYKNLLGSTFEHGINDLSLVHAVLLLDEWPASNPLVQVNLNSGRNTFISTEMYCLQTFGSSEAGS